jgi:hypothetical protein
VPAETEAEAEERRALQRKAYGRGGALTEAESRRLRALEDARRSDLVPEASQPADPERDASGTPPVASQEPLVVAGSDEPAEPGPNAPVPARPGPRHPLLRRVAAAVAASAVLLVIGIGAGWALFSPRNGLPLTDEQQQRRAELAAEAFDPGSVHAIAQDEQALVWYATQDDGEVRCLILDVGVQSQTDCLPTDEIAFGLSASLPVPPSEGEEENAAAGDVVYATLLFSTAGEPMAGIQRWGAGPALANQFSDAERTRAEALFAEGYELGLSVIGDFRGEPVWLADRLSTQGASVRCLIVDAWGSASCEPFETALQAGLGAQIVDVDAAGDVASISVLDLRFTTQQTPYLTITEAAGVTAVAPGDSVVIQSPPGDPIEVETPNRGADG